MKIHGNRVYLELPAPPESKLTISPELQNEIKEAYIKTLESLRVVGIGTGVSQNESPNFPPLKVGHRVFVEPNGLSKGIKLNIKGQDILSVSYFDIMHTWDD